MVFRIYIRDNYIIDMEDGEHELDNFAMSIERDLSAAEINYQGLIEVIEDTTPYIQVLCRDTDEQEHIKHILLSKQFVLCFERENHRYFGQYVEDEEKESFKHS